MPSIADDRRPQTSALNPRSSSAAAAPHGPTLRTHTAAPPLTRAAPPRMPASPRRVSAGPAPRPCLSAAGIAGAPRPPSPRPIPRARTIRGSPGFAAPTLAAAVSSPWASRPGSRKGINLRRTPTFGRAWRSVSARCPGDGTVSGHRPGGPPASGRPTAPTRFSGSGRAACQPSLHSADGAGGLEWRNRP